MNLPCQIMEDLLPLYAEGLTTPGTTQLVDEHLSQCEHCKKQLEDLQRHMEPPKAQVPLKQVRRSLNRRTANAVCLAAFALFVFLLSLFAWLNRPEYISFSDSLITLEQTGSTVYATFSPEVTSCRTALLNDPDSGEAIMYVEAWTCAWDRLLGKNSPQILVFDSQSHPVSAVYYCDYRNDGAAVLICGQESTQGNLFVLPRLVLGYYLILALGLAGITGLLWLLLRKTKGGKICGYGFGIPVSYLVGHLLVKGPSTLTYSAGWDFFLILLMAAGVYGFLISGVFFLRRVRQQEF